MKARLDQKQLMLVIGGVATLLVAGALAWLGLEKLGEKEAEAQALAERMGNPALAALLADPGGSDRATRDAQEIQKIAKGLQDRSAATAQWAQATQKLTGQGQEWSKEPGKWKDELISIQSRLQKEAKVEGVGLAPDFYLGLDSFRQKSPTAEEVPLLALHLSVAERLVKLLLEARKVKEQYPTVCEFRTLSGPGSSEGQKEQEKPAPSAGSGPRSSPSPVELERKKFRLEIRSSPEVLYQYVRLLTTDPALLILTRLEVTNEKQMFPLRSEIAKKFSTSPASAGGGASHEKKDMKEKKRLLEILAGEEGLDSVLEIDFVAWKNPEVVKPSAAPPPP